MIRNTGAPEPPIARRLFLRNGIGLGGSLLLCGACSSDDAQAPGPACSEQLAGGESMGTMPFVGESERPLEEVFGTGLDGRLYTDLSRLDATNLVTSTEAFYVRTRYPDLLMPEARWRISVLGLPSSPIELFLDELLPLLSAQGTQLMECSGNARGASFGLLSSADWAGIRLSDVLGRFDVPAGTTQLLVSGFDEHSEPSANAQSTPGASWIFRLEDLERSGAFLATELNGSALPADHGAPVRLVVPGWYGCTCIKWVDRLGFVGDDEAATSQMREFASRTHQSGVPELARDYLPAEIDLAAMPVRVEKWRVSGAVRYRVVGIQWGGSARAESLEIRFGGGPWQRLAACPRSNSTATWALWEFAWRPPAPGVYSITLRVPDPAIRTRRLDAGYYLREVMIDEV